MPSVELEYLKDILQKSSVYLEIGAGGSTVLANQYVKKEVYVIESDMEWIQKVKSDLPENHKVHFLMADIETIPNTWGYPGPHCSSEKKQMYSRSVLECKDKEVDTVLIDGRFRVACALHIHGMINETTDVLFDDFFNRLAMYSCILDYYTVYKRIGNMAHLRKKTSPIPVDVIRRFEMNPQ